MTGSLAVFNLAVVHEAIAAEHPDRECLVWRDRRLTWGQVHDRSRRFAGLLRAHGLGLHDERPHLAGWESGQDMVALFCRNSPAYLEAMLGAYKARCAPCNVNFRYTAGELAYLLTDARASAVVFDADLAPVVIEALAGWADPPLLIAIAPHDDSDSGDAAVAASLAISRSAGPVHDYETAIAAADPWIDPECSPDDLYVLYTGGTTGKPKGVLWRQGDFITGALGYKAQSLDDAVHKSTRGELLRVLPTAPFMHGAAHWNAWSAWLAGGTVIMQSISDRLDAADVWDTAIAERASSVQLVGDAFAVPLLDELERRATADGPMPASVKFIMSGGVGLSADNKRKFLDLLGDVRVVDIVGSSESGRQGVHTSSHHAGAASGRFEPSHGATVLDETRTRELEPGTDAIGWLATAGNVPLGYLGDRERTAATFPIVGGKRYSVAGDRARRGGDGSIELLGRESVTINTGGEKVFAEEVEDALKTHPAVLDAIVVGRPSERWGAEVVAVVALRTEDVEDRDLVEAAGRILARYKLPKAIVRRPQLQRSPSGKPDYAWARAQVV